MADAPVCHVSVDQSVAEPTGRKLPNVPRATDLSSALAAIEAIRQILMALTGQMAVRPPAPPSPLTQPGSRVGSQPPFPGQPQQGANIKFKPSNSKPDREGEGRWTEVQRVTEKKRIFNKDDHDQFVDVNRINKLVMKDSVTGEQWIWEAGSLGSGE